MLLRQKILIQTILFLLWVGSINYSVIYYLGLHQKGELLAKTINLSINFVIFIIVSTFLFSHYKIHKNINLPKLQVFWLLIGVIMLMSIGSLVQLKFRDVIPSFLRFTNYFGIFIIGYNIKKEYHPSYCIRILNPFIILSVISCLCFGFLEIFTNDIQYLNNAYRVSGSFKFHQLAFGMFLFTIITCVIFLKYNANDKILKKIIFGIVLALLLYLFMRVHSRLLSLSLFSTLLAVSFIGSKQLLAKVKIMTATMFLLVTGLFLMFNFDFQPRLKNLLLSRNNSGFVDSSSKTRLDIINNSLAAIDEVDVLFGKGLGTFNGFYEKAGLKKGVAAHNNYLLFFIEGGIVALAAFILFEFIMMIKFFKTIKNSHKIKYESDKKLLFAAATLFIGIEFLGFLLNNYYFYQSETIIWLLLGFCGPFLERKVKIHV